MSTDYCIKIKGAKVKQFTLSIFTFSSACIHVCSQYAKWWMACRSYVVSVYWEVDALHWVSTARNMMMEDLIINMNNNIDSSTKLFNLSWIVSQVWTGEYGK